MASAAWHPFSRPCLSFALALVAAGCGGSSAPSWSRFHGTNEPVGYAPAGLAVNATDWPIVMLGGGEPEEDFVQRWTGSDWQPLDARGVAPVSISGVALALDRAGRPVVLVQGYVLPTPIEPGRELGVSSAGPVTHGRSSVAGPSTETRGPPSRWRSTARIGRSPSSARGIPARSHSMITGSSAGTVRRGSSWAVLPTPFPAPSSFPSSSPSTRLGFRWSSSWRTTGPRSTPTSSAGTVEPGSWSVVPFARQLDSM